MSLASKDAPSPLSSPLPRVSGLRPLLPWFVSLLLSSYAVTLLTDASFWYATDVIKASAAESLWLSAFWGASYIFIALFAGRLADRYGARRMAILMNGASALAALIVWAVELHPSVLFLGALLLAYNVATTSLWPSVASAVTKVPGNISLNNRLTFYNIAWASTNCLALVTIGSLAAIDWSMIFVVPAAVSLLALVCLLFSGAVPRHEAPTGDSAAEAAIDRKESRGHNPKTLLHMAWTGNAMSYVAINVLLAILPQLTVAAGFPDKKVGTAVAAVWTFTRCVGFFAIWLWSRWHYKPGLLLSIQVLMTVSFLVVVAAPISAIDPTLKAAAFISAQATFGFCAAFLSFSSLYYAMHVSSGAGGHAGIHEALVGFGVTIGSTFGALFGRGEGTAALPGVAISVTSVLAVGVLAMAGIAWHGRRTAA